MAGILWRWLGGGILWKVVALAVLAGVLAGSVVFFRATRTIFDLLLENRRLKEALTNLTAESQIGYAKVLSQETRDGHLVTLVRFAETDRQDQTKVLFTRDCEVEGDVVHFDALIVTFDRQLVMDGRERALYLWRRVYGEKLAPEKGVPLAQPGEEPRRYADLFRKLPVRDRALFWSEIWKLADDPERLRRAGVSAVYGNVIYRRMRPGLIYVFKIDNSGRLFPETVPAL